MLVLFAVSPLLVVAVLLVGLRWPASRVMPLSLLTAVVVARWVWRIDDVQIAAAGLKGLVITLELLSIIFFALLMLRTLDRSGGLGVIRQGFSTLSPDPRIQAILIAWLFGSFIEGAAGFGTPAAVAVPLLIALRFPPAAAVMCGMMIQCTPVSFGALGTPILVGVQSGLSAGESLWNGSSPRPTLMLIAARVALVHAAVGTFIPLIMSCMLTRWFGVKRSYREGWEVWRFALAAGMSMTIPYTMVAFVLGPEFPSLFGGMIGLVIMITVLRVRRNGTAGKTPWRFAETLRGEEAKTLRGEEVAPSGRPLDPPDARTSAGRPMSLAKAWMPYVVLAALLVATRWPVLPLGRWIRSDPVTLRFAEVFGTSVSIVSTPLALPSFVFAVAIALTALVHRLAPGAFLAAMKDSFGTTLKASVALIFTVPMVQIFLNSSGGVAELPSMPLVLAGWMAECVGGAWPMVAPAVGGLGAFVAGSNTISNMMLSSFQYGVGQRIGADPLWIVALQAVGGAAGNTICVHNVVSACAVGNLVGQEGFVIRRTLPVFLYYAAVAGMIGLGWAALGR